MPHRSSLVFASLFAAGLVVIAWTEFYPSSPMFAAIGITGPRANSGRQCISGHEPFFMGWLTGRSIQCRFMWMSPNRSSYFEYANLNGLSHKLVSAGRFWTTTDTTQWRTQRDSIVTAIQRHGGREYACKYAPESKPGITYRYWRFPTFSVRLVAYREDPYAPDVGQINVDGYRKVPGECLSPPRDRTSDGEACGAEAAFRMPLPGDRVLCVRSWLWN